MKNARGTIVAIAALALAGCSSGSSSHGSASAVAASTSQTGGSTSTGGTGSTGGSSSPGAAPSPSPVPTVPASSPGAFAGIWEVSGTDPARGAYTGTASIAATTSGYAIERLVTYQTPAASGKTVASAWNLTATVDPTGLHVRASLRRAHMIARLGSQTRTGADRAPLVLDTILGPPGGGNLAPVGVGTTLEGSFALPQGALAERWVSSGPGAPPLFPRTDETQVPIHGPPPATVTASMFGLFAQYHTLPAIAPYVARPEFQAAIHSVAVDHTARDYYRAVGAGTVVVLDGVTDDISVFEETPRACAFGQLLHEKAERFDKEMEQDHVDQNGFIANLAGTAPPYQRRTSGDGALHTGSWVASQVYRYQATGDAQALANVRLGVKALATLVDISPDKTQFARAIEDATTAPASWTRGTGNYAALAWLPGGNNDMLHGIEYGFLAAEQVLPPGDPLRAAIGAQAKSLVQNVKIAQNGTHAIFLGSVAWKTTGDPAMQAIYQSALSGSWKDRIWTTGGNGIANVWGIADWSGHHLGALTFCGLRILGGATPTADEATWQQVGATGARAAFTDQGASREGLLAVIAGAFGASGAADQAKDVLAEIPCPKPTGDATISRDVMDGYCVSPYPSNPWKNDWMTNPGRVQALTGVPLFYRGTDENYWARNPLFTGGSVVAERETSQDYLHAYWLGRAAGVFSASD